MRKIVAINDTTYNADTKLGIELSNWLYLVPGTLRNVFNRNISEYLNLGIIKSSCTLDFNKNKITLNSNVIKTIN